jgi:hypothetical protein
MGCCGIYVDYDIHDDKCKHACVASGNCVQVNARLQSMASADDSILIKAFSDSSAAVDVAATAAGALMSILVQVCIPAATKMLGPNNMGLHACFHGRDSGRVMQPMA